MWTYGGDALAKRLSLSQRQGFLFDYWLFLHADQTHSIWSSRPIGFSLVAKSSLNETGRVVRVFYEEVASLSKLTPYFPTPPPNETPVDPVTKRLSKAWRAWLELGLTKNFQKSLVTAIVDRLSQRIEDIELPELSFLLRQLSAQLADDDLTLNSVVSQALAALRDATPDSAVALVSASLLPGPTKRYRVRFSLVPVEAPGRMVRQAKAHDPVRLIFSGDVGERKELVGIEDLVEAHHPSQAVAHAMNRARDILQRLRVGHYIRTTLRGAVEVDMIEDPPSTVRVPLPLPFGLDRGSHRQAPRLPNSLRYVRNRLEKAARGRWDAAVWHISAAIGQWPEDTHAAASAVWQGLESFAGNRTNVSSVLVDSYLRHLPVNLLSDLARAISRQRNALIAAGQRTDWHSWNEDSQALAIWIAKAMHPASPRRFSAWKRPAAPLIAHDASVGLFGVWRSALTSGVAPKWADERLRRDMQWLNAMRNSIVHSGVRLGNERVAAYLGRVGLEILFAEMSSVAVNTRQTDSGGQ